jgi:prophage regulatory protein
MAQDVQPSRIVFVRRRQVEIEAGCSRSTIYLRIAQGLWPKPIKLGARSVGWVADEVTSMNAARVAGLSDDELRALVVTLETARTRRSR